MLIRNMLLKYYAPDDGGNGGGGGGIEITPEIQKLIDERVTSEYRLGREPGAAQDAI